MATSAVLDPAQVQLAPTSWSLPARIAFRFVAVYFTLYCLLTQIVVGLVLADYAGDIGDLSTLLPVRPIVAGVATRLFHTAYPVLPTISGSGDRIWDWTLVFCLLVFSTLATIVWSILDRRRPGYADMQKWIWLFFCICLASQMFTYGFAKIVPLQMPRPMLFQLVEPFGNMSPMGVLWSFVGASPAYECLCGCAELLGGILVLIPHTRVLGALVCLVDMTYVFTLNMTYDVPVKLLSFQLALLSAVILTPSLRRLANFFLLNRAIAPQNPVYLFRSLRANRLVAAAQVLIALWLFGTNLDVSRKYWKIYGGGQAKSVLYGIWNVERYTSDGIVVPALISDPNRPRRVLFQAADQALLLNMNDQREWLNPRIDAVKNTVTLESLSDRKVKANFSFTRPAPDRLTFDGTLNGHKVQMDLRAVDLNSIQLLSRGFHWVQEEPFNH